MNERDMYAGHAKKEALINAEQKMAVRENLKQSPVSDNRTKKRESVL